MLRKYKKLLAGSLVLLVITAGIVVYIFTDKFTDTAERKPHYIVNAADFIKEFQQSDSAANRKYTEKIVAVKGIIGELTSADTTANVKFIDTLSGDYIIFAFQQQNLAQAKSLKAGDLVTIKGSCSGGNYSEILGTRFITFKRSVVDNN